MKGLKFNSNYLYKIKKINGDSQNYRLSSGLKTTTIDQGTKDNLK